MSVDQPNPGGQLIRRLHEVAASGEESSVAALLKERGGTGIKVKLQSGERRHDDRSLLAVFIPGKEDSGNSPPHYCGCSPDAKDEQGWTSLMLAARNGHAGVARLLLDAGCDRQVINNSGQTALDVASFWNHRHVVEVLSDGLQSDQSGASFPSSSYVNFYSGSPLDRCGNKRKDSTWIAEQMKLDSTRFILFSGLKPLVKSGNNDAAATTPMILFTVSHKEVPEIVLKGSDGKVIFLGTDSQPSTAEGSQPSLRAWFAVDISSVPEEEVKTRFPDAEPLEPFPGTMLLEKKDAAIYAQARSLLAWQDRYQYCATCGSQSRSEEGGYKMTCTDQMCRSRKGVHNTSYPRLDPTVIMAVLSRDRKRVMLGRGTRFPRGMYSCLAGFMEPGESIEEACRREVHEESGVVVGHVQYHSSQPWPMPASLMIGCLAQATQEEIQVDKDELEDARWFGRSEVLQMLNGNHPEGLRIPPEQAIAHVLIRAWVNMASNL